MKICSKLAGLMLFGFALALIAVSCGKKEDAERSPGLDSGLVDVGQSAAMPALPPDSAVHQDTMTAAGREISMEANLWYNLMPGPDDESAPQLNVQVRLMTEEKTTVPADWVIDYIWVAMGGGTWGIGPDQEQIGSGPSRERMFHGGPIYDAEEGARSKELPRATITVRVSDKNGEHHYFRKVDQPVQKVY